MSPSFRRAALSSALAVTLAITGAVVAAAAPAAAAEAPDPHPPVNTSNAPGANAVSLSSKPGALATIWLSFDGGTMSSTGWNDSLPDPTQSIVYSAITNDSVALRTAVFDQVSEAFSPFDVNVTTVFPGAAALDRTSPADLEYGMTLILTDDNLGTLGVDPSNTADGIALSGSFGNQDQNYTWVSTEVMSGGQEIGKVGAHEVGHTLGLSHQGAGADAYYSPNSGIWGPIMGSPLDVPFGRWSDSQYPQHLGTVQDDLAVMTNQTVNDTTVAQFFAATGDPYSGDYCSEGEVEWVPDGDACDSADVTPENTLNHHTYYSGRIAYSADAVGNTPATATSLALSAAGKANAAGIIETNPDVDVFSVTVGAGPLKVTALPAAVGPMLDIALTVRNAAGELIASSSPDDSSVGSGQETTIVGADASVTVIVPAGTYSIALEGVGFGDVATNSPTATPAAPEYGSLGRYTLEVTAAVHALAATGSETPWLAATGAMLLLVAGGALMLGRRRILGH